MGKMLCFWRMGQDRLAHATYYRHIKWNLCKGFLLIWPLAQHVSFPLNFLRQHPLCLCCEFCRGYWTWLCCLLTWHQLCLAQNQTFLHLGGKSSCDCTVNISNPSEWSQLAELTAIVCSDVMWVMSCFRGTKEQPVYNLFIKYDPIFPEFMIVGAVCDQVL